VLESCQIGSSIVLDNIRKVLNKKRKATIILVIIIAVALNLSSFLFAFPETFKPEPAGLARDFSAYYIGEWRLFHNPTKIYSGLVWPGDYQILPKPQTFKYTPSFLVFFAPFLFLSYQDSLTVFDILQVTLIPILAFFVYKMVKNKNLAASSVVAVLVLLDPLPKPPLIQVTNNLLHSSIIGFNAAALAPTYFVGYAVGNAHVLQAIFLVGAIYFGFAKKPWLSALLFTLGVFDPRAALFALPLLLWYNRQKLVKFISGATIFLAITNLPFFFYHNEGSTFLLTETNGRTVSQMYPYDWLPLYVVASLMVFEILTWSTKAKESRSPKPANKD
jgi:hypothetical protein